MKKLAVLACMFFLLTGCNQNKDVVENVKDDVEITFKAFENTIEDIGISFENGVEVAKDDLLGAAEGYTYKTDEGTIRVHCYTDSDALETIKKQGYIEEDGTRHSVVVNGNLVLFNDELPYQDQIQGSFEKIKTK